MSVITVGALHGRPPAPLYQTTKGRLGQLFVSDEQIDQLRIDAVRRCDAICKNLADLQEKPATLAQLLSGPDGVRKLLVEQVDFAAADIVRKAAAKLESLLGEDGMVADPRSEFGGASLHMDEIREMVDGLNQQIAPYERMREQLK